jgi:hypothetical protein
MFLRFNIKTAGLVLNKDQEIINFLFKLKIMACKPKKSKKSKSQAQPARKAPCDDGVRTIQKIYRQFIKVSDGAEGLNGSIRPK